MTDVKPTLRVRIHGVMFKLPLMLTCEQFEEFIVAYLDDELSSRQKFVFEMHLKLCRECREYLAAYRTSIAVTKSVLTDKEVFSLDEVPEDLIEAVLAARSEK
ncbi:MAG: anti-sigma factor family protein [Rhizobiaceae bacterium]